MNEVIENIVSRRSCPKLTVPAPTRVELESVLKCGMNAPDHGRLKPWRFVVLEGEALDELGKAFLAIKKEELGELTDSQESNFLQMPRRAPVIIVAIAQIKEHPKVPPIEQAVAVGCSVQNMQLALQSLGYGAMWRTGEFAFNDAVKRYFKAKETDEILGFLYIGTPESKKKEVPSQPIEEAVEFWS